MITPAKPWDKADLFFLENSLHRGMPVEVVAGFLGRSAAEVAAKAERMNREVISDEDAFHPAAIERPLVA
jgi:hypothetical protein